MKPSLTLLLLFLLRLLTAQAVSLPDTLELTALIQVAKSQALDVLIAERNATLAGLDTEVLAAQLKPQLGLSANLPNYFSSFSETTQPDGTVAFRPITINNSFVQLRASQAIATTGGQLFVSTNLQRFDDFENDQLNYNGVPLRVGIEQPILAFNAFKWQKRVLPAIEAERQSELAVASARAAADVSTLFFDLLFAQQNREIALTNQAASQRLFKIAQERYGLGKINRGDLVQIELELTAAGQSVLSAERNLINTSVAIYNFIGLPYDGRTLAAYRPVAPPPITTDRATLLQRMSAARPEFRAAVRRQLEAQREVERAKRDFGPQFTLRASLGLVRSDPELAAVYQNPQAEQIVSLSLNVPILDWGTRKRLIRQSTTELEYTKTLNERIALSLTAQADQLLKQYNELGKELELARRISELAEERFTISRESYLLGSIPLTELTLAQQNRDQLARVYLNTLSAYWSVWTELKTLVD